MKQRLYLRKIILCLSVISVVIIMLSFLFQLNTEIDNARQEVLIANQYRAEESARIIDEKLTISFKVFALVSQFKEVNDYQNSTDPEPILSLETQKRLSIYANLLSNIDSTFFVYNKYTDVVISNSSVKTIDAFYNAYGIDDNEEIKSFINNDTFNYTERLQILDTEANILFITKTNSDNGSNTLMMSIPKSSLISHVVASENLYNFTIQVTGEEIEHAIISKINSQIKYLYETDANNITISDRLLYILLNLSILFFVAVALVIIFSRRIYAPVRKLISLTDDDNTYLPVKDEFERIKLHIDHIKSYSSGQISNKNLLLKELLLGHKRKNLQEELRKNEINLTDNNFYFLFIGHNKEHSHSDFLSEQLIKHTLTNIYKQHNISTDITVLEMPMKNFVVFISNSHRKEMIEALQGTLLDTSECFIVLSKISTTSNVSNRYANLFEVTKSAIIKNDNKIIIEEDMIIDKSNSFNFSDSSKKLLLYNISKKNKTAYLQTVQHEIIDYIENHQDSKPAVFDVIAKTISSMLPNLKLSGEIQDALNSTHDIDELKNVISLMFLDCYNIINAENETNNTKAQLINYIIENYDKDISLQDMAEYFNLSANYIGILFKEKTGDTFKAYLNAYRIQMARQILLETPNAKIKDVSLSVGFTNANTFIRLFKEREGVSPGQYQKSNCSPHNN